jgi:CheY-like chemotaxis protein
LVVDDDASVLEALSSALAPRLEPLFRVETALSGEEALEILESGVDSEIRTPVALVISDEKMPGMQGNDLLIALRQHEHHRHGGRILITGYASLDSAKRAINEAEVDRYFSKPWDTEGTLMPAVAEVLARFVRNSSLDVHLVSDVIEDGANLGDVLFVRREWWLYLTHLGDEPEDYESNRTPSSFAEPEDADAVHVILRRYRANEKRLAATIRLRKEQEDNIWRLDTLAFWPEDAGDETETLLLHASIQEACRRGAAEVRVAAPRLRREVYEKVGFVPFAKWAKEAEREPAEQPMVWSASSSRKRAGDSISAFNTKYDTEHRLCGCCQNACPALDYIAPKRSYYCPLDVREGRVPEGYPVSTTT